MNWMRRNLVSTARARVLTVRVLASPGTPSMRTWPSASRPMRRRSTMVFWPTITLPTSSRSLGRKTLSCWIFSWMTSMSRFIVPLDPKGGSRPPVWYGGSCPEEKYPTLS